RYQPYPANARRSSWLARIDLQAQRGIEIREAAATFVVNTTRSGSGPTCQPHTGTRKAGYVKS
ncbi:hypothetical protein, partial [Mycobacterium tuberculosis]|uniref:hypothetical protein n=1 Tax=Mycobacterium tuberculosis TaxID=1773 RepID=UPI000B18E939